MPAGYQPPSRWTRAWRRVRGYLSTLWDALRGRDPYDMEMMATDPTIHERGKDLGTYHLRVELEDGRGWIDRLNTGARYINGSVEHAPLNASRLAPIYESEAHLFENMVFMYTEGNYACDCNKLLFWCRAHRQAEPEEVICGDMMTLKRLTAIRPDGSEVVLWTSEEPNP